jgi:hypothetical protein
MSNMIIKYAVIKLSSYESGRIFIAPDMVLADEALAKDRAQFASQAYREPHVMLELRPIETVR